MLTTGAVLLACMHTAWCRPSLHARAVETKSASTCNRGTGTPQVCVAVNLPTEADAQNDMYIRITGPSTRQYTGLGFSATMTDSLMLLIFPTTGNVTASMRLSSGHSRPALAEASIAAEVLPGSRSDGSSFVANIRCRNCRKWSTGAIKSDTPQDFIYAYGSATGVEVGNQAITTYHGPFSKGHFSLNLAAAKGPGGVPESSGTPVRDFSQVVQTFAKSFSGLLM